VTRYCDVLWAVPLAPGLHADVITAVLSSALSRRGTLALGHATVEPDGELSIVLQARHDRRSVRTDLTMALNSAARRWRASASAIEESVPEEELTGGQPATERVTALLSSWDGYTLWAEHAEGLAARLRDSGLSYLPSGVPGPPLTPRRQVEEGGRSDVVEHAPTSGRARPVADTVHRFARRATDLLTTCGSHVSDQPILPGHSHSLQAIGTRNPGWAAAHPGALTMTGIFDE